MNYYINYISPIGKIIIISDGENIIGLFFENQKYFMNGINNDLLHSEIPILHKTREWLDRYFKGKRPNPLNLPLKPNGSFFRRLVWQHLLEIPYGSVVTYKDITEKIEHDLKKKMSCQAVGGAISHNPISIIIPCHRVIGSNNSLIGYAGGITKKKQLLELEKVNIKSKN